MAQPRDLLSTGLTVRMTAIGTISLPNPGQARKQFMMPVIPNPGTYTARVKVERNNLSAEDTALISVSQSNLPTVDIKANNADGSVSIPYNTSATLTWTSSYADACTASNAWSGQKPLSGSESTGNLTGKSHCLALNPQAISPHPEHIPLPAPIQLALIQTA